MFSFLRRKARWLRGRRCVPPPLSPGHFPVKSLRQLGFFVAHRHRHFYVLVSRARPARAAVHLARQEGRGGVSRARQGPLVRAVRSG